MEPEQRPNKRLRLQRRLRGWSQEDVAAGLHRLAASLGEQELGVDATMVSRWERGTRKPRPRYVRLLCRLFELPAEQLGIVEDVDLVALSPNPRVALEDDDVERRDFIQHVSGLLGVAAIPLPMFEASGPEPWERLSRVLREPGRVDDETVDHIENITIALERLGPTQVASRALLGPVTGHLDAITLLLRGTLPTGLRNRLCSLAGEMAGFAGWLRWNMDDPHGAASYFRVGLDAAREAGDRALGAYLMGSAACQPPYRENPADRIRMLENRTFGFAQSDATPATRVWLAAKEADARAMLGDASGSLGALERADRALELVGGYEVAARPRFLPVDRTWLAGERGASLARLGRTEEARAILKSVLGRLGPTTERDRLWLCTSLAATHVRDDPEEACRIATSTFERASKMQLEPVLRMVERLREDLEPLAPSPDVEAFDEQVRAAGARVAS
jgi:transcriptional regulator with XRE-family HTH domain